MPVDYHLHPLGHRGGDYTRDLLAGYCAAAQARGLDEIGFSDHDEYRLGLDPQVLEATAARFPHMQVRLGMEVSFRPGREQEIIAFARRLDLDYVIGSVHHIGEWMFDHPDYRMIYDSCEIPELYHAYFNIIEKLAGTGIFDIVGHLDLVKVFGYRPAGDIIAYAGKALMAIAGAGLTVEVNTAGLYKPCAEIYPSEELLKECYRLNIPVTFGSDAHEPAHTGRDLTLARELIYRIGYRKIARFKKRQQFYNYL